MKNNKLKLLAIIGILLSSIFMFSGCKICAIAYDYHIIVDEKDVACKYLSRGSAGSLLTECDDGNKYYDVKDIQAVPLNSCE